MTLLWVAVGSFVLMAAIFLGLLKVAVRWGRELIELQQHGIATTGIVLDKVSYTRRGTENRYLRYQYADAFGKPHRRKVLVTPEAWESHQRGGPIQVIYSQRYPKTSAPKYLIDLAATQTRAHRPPMDRDGESPHR